MINEKSSLSHLSADDLYEQGIPHHRQSIQLVKLIDGVFPELDLEVGGDGDIGETIAYAIDYLINNNKLNIEIL